MLKDKRGKPPKMARRNAVKELRDKNYSYAEIAKMLNMSRSLAWYYDNKKLLTVDKDIV